MKREAPQVYAKGLKYELGIDLALKISERCLKDTQPTNWTGLDTRQYVTEKRKSNKFEANKINLWSTHKFWQQVTGILRSMNKSK